MPLENLTSAAESKSTEPCIDHLSGDTTPAKSCDQSEMSDNKHKVEHDLSFAKLPNQDTPSEKDLFNELMCNNKEISSDIDNEKCASGVAGDSELNTEADNDYGANCSENFEFCHPSLDKFADSKVENCQDKESDVLEISAEALNSAELDSEAIELAESEISRKNCPKTWVLSKNEKQTDPKVTESVSDNDGLKRGEFALKSNRCGLSDNPEQVDPKNAQNLINVESQEFSPNKNVSEKSESTRKVAKKCHSGLMPETANNPEVTEEANSCIDSKIMENVTDQYSDVSSVSSKLSCTVKSIVENEGVNSDSKIEALVYECGVKKSGKKEKVSDSEMEDGEIPSSSENEENLVTSQPELFSEDHPSLQGCEGQGVNKSRKRSLVEISSESGEEKETANMGFEGELPTSAKSKKRKINSIVYNDTNDDAYGAQNEEYYTDGQAFFPDWDAANDENILNVYKRCSGETGDCQVSSSSEYDDLRDMLKRRKTKNSKDLILDQQLKRKFTFPKGMLKDSPSDSGNEMDVKKISPKEKKRKEKTKEAIKEFEEKLSKKSSKEKKKKRSERPSESFDSDSSVEDGKVLAKKKSKKLEKQIKKKMKKLRKLEKEHSEDDTSSVKQSVDDKNSVKVKNYPNSVKNLYVEEAKKTKVDQCPRTKVEPNARDSSKRLSSNSKKPRSKESSSSPTAEYFVQNGWANLDNLMQQFVDFQFKNLAQSMQNNQTSVETSIVTPNAEGPKSEMSISPVAQVQSPVMAGPESLNSCSVPQNHVVDQIFSYQNSAYCNQYQMEPSQYRFDFDQQMGSNRSVPEVEQDSLLVEPDKPKTEQTRTFNQNYDARRNFDVGKFVNSNNLTVLTKIECDLEEGEFGECNENPHDESFDVEKELDLFLETARNEAKLEETEKSVDDFIREQRKIAGDHNQTASCEVEHQQQLRSSPKKDVNGAMLCQNLPDIKEEPEYFAAEPPPEPVFMDNRTIAMEPRRLSQSSNIAITLDMPEFISPTLHTPKSEDDVFSRDVRICNPTRQWVQEPVGVLSEEEARSFRGSLNDIESCSESIVDEPPSTIPQVEANYKIAKACLKPQTQFENQESSSPSHGFQSLIRSPQKEMEFANIACNMGSLHDQVTGLVNADVSNINASEIEIPENIRSLFAGEPECENRNLTSVDILASLKSNLAKPTDDQMAENDSPEIANDSSKEQHRGTYEPFFKNPRIKKFADEQISLSGLPDPRLLAMNRKLRASNFRKDLKRVKRWNNDIEIERVRRPLRKIKPIKLLDGDVDDSSEQRKPGPSRSQQAVQQFSSSSYEDTSVQNYQTQSLNYQQPDTSPIAHQQQSSVQDQKQPPPSNKLPHRRSPGAYSGTYDTRYVPLDWIDPDEPPFDPRTNSALILMRFLVTDFWATQFVIDDFWVQNDNDDEDNSLLVQPDLTSRLFPNPSIRNSFHPEKQAPGSFRPEFSPTYISPTSAPPNYSLNNLSAPQPALDPRLASARVVPNQPKRFPSESSGVNNFDAPINMVGTSMGDEGHRRPGDTDYRQINKQPTSITPNSLASVPHFPTPRHIPAATSAILPPSNALSPFIQDASMLIGTPLIMPNQDVDLRTMHQQHTLSAERPDALPVTHFPDFPPPVAPQFPLLTQEPPPSFSHPPPEPLIASEPPRLTLTTSGSRSHVTSNLQPTTRKLSSYNPKPREKPKVSNQTPEFVNTDDCFGDVDMRQNKPSSVIPVSLSTELVSTATTVTSKKNPLAPKFDTLSPPAQLPNSSADISEVVTPVAENSESVVEKAPPEPKKPKKNPLMPVFS